MAFPTIPTPGASTLLQSNQPTATTTHTFPSFSDLPNTPGALLLAIIVCYQGGSTNAEFSSWGGGFTEFVDQAANSATIQSIGAAYIKNASGSESGTFTVTTVASTRSVMFLMEIPGAHSSTNPEATAKANGTTSAADPAALDPANWAAEDTLWIAVAVNGEISLTGTFGGITAAPTNYGSYVDSGIVGGDVIGALEGAVAFRQLNASSENVGAFTLDTSAAGNSALLIAVRPAAAANPNAENAAATGTAETPTASVAPNADQAASTGTAETPAVSIEVNAELVSIAAAAESPTAGISPNAGEASAAAAALDATVETTTNNVNVDAECATATAVAEAPSTAIEVPAEGVAATGAAEAATAAISSNAELIEVGAAAESPAVSIETNAEPATVIAAAETAATAISVNAEVVAVAAAAHDATVETTGATNAQAECAEAVGEAGAAAVALDASAGVAAVAAAAEAGAAAIEVVAEAATAVGTALDAAVQVFAEAECATATAIALDPQVQAVGEVATALHPNAVYVRPEVVSYRRLNPVVDRRRPSTVLAGPGPAVSYRRADILVAGR